MSVQGNCTEKGSLMAFFSKCVSSVGHKRDVILRRDIKAWMIKVRITQRLCCWSTFFHLNKREAHVLLLDHHFFNCNVAYVDRSRVGRKRIWGRDVFQNVHDAYVYEAYGIVFCQRWYLAQRTLNCVCEHRFTEHECYRRMCYLS